MATAAGKTPKVLASLDRALGVLAAVTLFFMMGVTFIDVAMRKVLPGTFPAADELTKMSLGVLIFAALPLVTARREHVVISLFDGLFSRRWNTVRMIVVDVASAVLLAVLAWRLAGLAIRFGTYDDRTLFLDAPWAPFAWFMFATAALASALALSLAIGRLRSGDKRA